MSDRLLRALPLPKLRQLRWLLLMVFPAGYALTQHVFTIQRAEFLDLTLASALGCFVLLVRLRSAAVTTWPVWILFGTFLVAYYIKFYLLVLTAASPSSSDIFVITARRLALISQPDIAIVVYRFMTIAFLVFCVVAALVVRPRQLRERPSLVEPQSHAAGTIRRLMYFGIGILALTTAVALVTGILGAGIAAERQGFQLLGWIFYARSVLTVVIFLVVLQYGLENYSSWWTKVGIALLVVFALSEIVVTSTRASLLLAALSMGALYGIVRGRLDRRVGRGVLLLLAAGVFLFPIVTYYRNLRIMGGEAGASLILEAVRSMAAEGSLSDLALTGGITIIMRFIGADSLFFLTDAGSWLGLSGFIDDVNGMGTVSRYFTRVVVGVPPSVAHAEAPSLVGWFLLTGGIWNLVLGLSLYIGIGWFVWVRLSRSKLIVRPVAQVQFLLLWLSLASEGTLDQRLIAVMAVVASLAGCELLLRSGRRRLRSAPLLPQSAG